MITNLKKDRKISIEEIVVAEEKVVFKLPKELKLMAVYTKLNQNKIEEILSNYNLGKLNSFKGIEEGIENTNYFLSVK